MSRRMQRQLEKDIASQAMNNAKKFWRCVNSTTKTKSGISQLLKQGTGNGTPTLTESDKENLRLSIIFNKCPPSGKIPVNGNQPKSQPYSKNIAANYLPNHTSSTCKIMESLIRENIIDYMTTNKLLSKRQTGFVSGRSTVNNY